jgi:hypothetical protein
MIQYIFLFVAIFSTVILISYLIHVGFKFQDSKQPTKEALVDGFLILLFCAFWCVTIFFFNNPI